MTSTPRALLVALAFAAAGCAVAPDDPEPIGAPGVSIEQIAIYQGVKRPLLVDGEEVDSDVPLVAGRDALIRVFYSTDSDYDGGEVTGRLYLDGSTIEVTTTLGSSSDDDDLDSTVNFDIDGEDIDAVLSWAVELTEPLDAPDNPDARYPQDGSAEVAIDGEINVLRLVIAPFAYEADGSGRLPDTSTEQVERIRETFLKLYPVSDVEVSVREPQPWNQPISANGDGWIGPGIALLGYRSSDGAPDDVYYYGMFNPTETVQQFCQLGCLLGVTLLNNDPPDVGSVAFRLALGVGFTEQAPLVAAHEIGHAHGRPHSPCGPPGNVPADIDPSYPYDDGSIGVWGYDIVDGELADPDRTDVMGYCDDQWISDYTYTALHRRGQNVNLGWMTPPPARTWDILVVDGDGQATWAASTERARPVAGEEVDVTLFAAGGAPTSARGRFVRFDHLPGGWLAVPRGELTPVAAEFVVDGRFWTTRR